MENEYTVEHLKDIAQKLIMHYLESRIKDPEMLERETKRIEEMFERVKIRAKQYEEGSCVGGRNKGRAINIYFFDENDISEDEFLDAIKTIIHEYYHSVSKAGGFSYCSFLEEGYVTKATSDTVRHAMENPIDTTFYSKEELVGILRRVELTNAYFPESEFVRSTDVVLRQHGYDGSIEYLFTKNGFGHLCEIATQVSPEFGTIMKNQGTKELGTPSSSQEKEFFQNMFGSIDYSQLTETDIEMNSLLQNYLIENGIIDNNPKIRSLLCKCASGLVGERTYTAFLQETKEMSHEELQHTIASRLKEFERQYVSQNGFPQDPTEIGSFAVALYTEMGINASISSPELMKSILYRTTNEEEMLENISNSFFLGAVTDRELGGINDSNFWDKAKRIAEASSKIQSKDRGLAYKTLYKNLLRLTKTYIAHDQEYGIDNGEYNEKIAEIIEMAGFSKEEYAQYRDKPEDLFNRAIAIADEEARASAGQPSKKKDLFTQVLEVISHSVGVTWETVRKTAITLIEQLKRDKSKEEKENNETEI